jgi:hypothetical protein
MVQSKKTILFGIVFLTSSASAQQTGVVAASKPSASARAGIVVRTVTPKPTCETSAQDGGGELRSLPEMVFGREFNELICVRHPDGRTEKGSISVPNGLTSADGTAIAYWNQKTQELHVYLVASQVEMLVEKLPGAKMRSFAWSARGHLLSYLVGSANPPGVRAFDLDMNERKVFPGSFAEVVASPDPEHVVGVSAEGVESFAMADGKREAVAQVREATSAEYSANATYLGILSNESIAAQNAPAAPPAADAADDDEPDCRGGSFALILQDRKSKQLKDIPYPDGFDTVLDFSFSPDERAIAVTFGVVGCDYPGDRARIYLVSLPDMKLTPISPEDRLSVKPVWTPDGKSLVYSDYTGSDSPLVAFDLTTHKVTKLTNPGQFGPDEWLGWR